MKKSTKRRLAFLAGFALYFGLIWTFWYTPVVYPLKIFVVLLHEVSHALAAVATGGALGHITLDPLEGGATYAMGGSPILVLSAGYLGSLLWGVLFVVAARARRPRAGLTVALVGAAVAVLTIFYVRTLFGVGFGLLFGGALVLSGRKLPDLWNRRLLLVLGLTSCLYAILDIKSDILDRPYLQSDAAMLHDLTGIPTVLWGGLWIVLAVTVSGMLFRWAYRKA